MRNQSGRGLPRQLSGIEFEEAADGLVTYQGENGKVCYLNPTATLILSLCNGSLTVAEIAAIVAKAFSLPSLPIDDVERSLGEFDQAELIEWVPDQSVSEMRV